MKLTYIAGPLALALAFTAGNMINSPDSAAGESVTITPNHKPSKPSRSSNQRNPNNTSRANPSKPKPSRVATSITKIKDLNSRIKVLVNTVDSLSSDELQQLLVDFATNRPLQNNTFENKIIINALVSHGAIEALEFIHNHKKLNRLLEIAVQSAARLSPAQTVDWVKGSPGTNLMASAIRGMAENNVRLAMSMIEEVDSTSTKGRYACGIAKQLLMLPTREAWDWISDKGDGAQYTYINQAHSGQLEELLLLIQDTLESSRQQSLFNSIVRAWSRCDPKAAKNWITSHQPQKAITLAEIAIWNLAEQDPEGTGEWLQQFASAPKSTFKNMVNNYISVVAAKRPDLAVSQLKHYTGETREFIKRKIYISWERLDPEFTKTKAFRDSHTENSN